MKTFIAKLEAFIRRVRWKALFFDQSNDNDDSHNANFSFRTVNTPPQNEHLKYFENDLYEMARKIQFRRTHNSFQKQLSKDAKQIRQSSEMLIAADKSTNLYKLTVQEYEKLLSDNITQTYKKTDRAAINVINEEAKDITKKHNLEERVEQYAERKAFVTLKDHKTLRTIQNAD